jgi:predicted Zn-dependent protease
MYNNGSGFRFIPLVIGLLAVLFFAAKGCQTGPFGRKQLISVSPAQELQLGKQAYQQILSQSQVVNDRDALPRAVVGVGNRLATAAKHPTIVKALHLTGDRRFEWEYHVVVDRQINAFCLPGGKVVVNTGIIDVCDTEAGLAVVMGHEIGHALARHGVERMSQAKLKQIGLTAAAFSLSGLDYRQQQTIMGMLGAGARFGIELPFSRDNESEADRIGVMLMAVAGYDPNEAAKFWIRMARATGGNKGSSFASTHPSHEQRQRDLETWADDPEVRELFRASTKADGERKLPRVGERGPISPVRPGSDAPAPKPKPKPPQGGSVEFK